MSTMDILKQNKQISYEVPEVRCISIVISRCLAGSCTLVDMDENEIYDEEF